MPGLGQQTQSYDRPLSLRYTRPANKAAPSSPLALKETNEELYDAILTHPPTTDHGRNRTHSWAAIDDNHKTRPLYPIDFAPGQS